MDIREVPASQLRWEVGWQDLLVMEPRMSSAAVTSGAPDRLVVHRKGRPGHTEAALPTHSLAHELRIFPNTPQVTPRLHTISAGHLHVGHVAPRPTCLRQRSEVSVRRGAGDALPPCGGAMLELLAVSPTSGRG